MEPAGIPQEKSTLRILVTGGTGFLGSYLLRYLLRMGHTNILALRRRGSAMDLVADLGDSISWLEGDIRDFGFLSECLEGVHWVFHAAAMVSFDRKDYRDMERINTHATADLVNFSLLHGVRKFCFVSSVAALGRAGDGEIIDEDTPWKEDLRHSYYGITKCYGEQEVWRGMEEGLKAVIVNPSMILGSGRWNEGTPHFFRLIRSGFPFIPRGTGNWVDVRDVVTAMYCLMVSEIHSQRFILVGGDCSFQNFFQSIATHLHCKPPQLHLPRLLEYLVLPFAWLQARFTGRRAFITPESIRLSGHHNRYDHAKSIRIPGFEGYRPLEQTIAETATAFKEEERSNHYFPLVF